MKVTKYLSLIYHLVETQIPKIHDQIYLYDQHNIEGKIQTLSQIPVDLINYMSIKIIIKHNSLEQVRIRPRCLKLFFLIFEFSRFQLASFSLSLSFFLTLSPSALYKK